MCNCTKPPSQEPSLPSAPEQRQDPITGQWRVLAGNRWFRPIETSTPNAGESRRDCPFCRGHESETTPTVAQYYLSSHAQALDDWQVRVVTNLYPAFVPVSIPPAPTGEAKVSRGHHEVIVEAPRHALRLTELTHDEVRVVMEAYRDRIDSLGALHETKSVLLFKNCGREAGMSREHIHSQLLALPEVSPALEAEWTGASRYYEAHGSCPFCDLVQRELAEQTRVVAVNTHFIAICPYASRTDYETWIMPRQHAPDFSTADAAILDQLAQILWQTLAALEVVLPNVAYNYILHTNPFDMRPKDHYHWHIEIIPRTSKLAGLEWGGGIHVATKSPEHAATELRRGAKVE